MEDLCHRVGNLAWSPTSDKNSRVECECELETLEVVKLVFSRMSLRLMAWLPPLLPPRRPPPENMQEMWKLLGVNNFTVSDHVCPTGGKM